MGEALLERETLTREEVEMILAGTPLPAPEIDLPEETPDTEPENEPAVAPTEASPAPIEDMDVPPEDDPPEEPEDR